jgi:hypothetical protein
MQSEDQDSWRVVGLDDHPATRKERMEKNERLQRRIDEKIPLQERITTKTGPGGLLTLEQNPQRYQNPSPVE